MKPLKPLQPLQGVRVLDLTTLLPGPLATLILAEAGAEVLKVERPGTGDELRIFPPQMEGESLGFALLNRGKQSLALDLKTEEGKEALLGLVKDADVLVEQFRPGVMKRLGLDYEVLKSVNPGLIYCSITGYGQSGDKANRAGHDLNYMAATGMLAMGGDETGRPVIPPALVADIGGGTYPAVMNVLLALMQRDRTGEGCWLDIAMTDHLFPFMVYPLGEAAATGKSPLPGRELLTGGSPRYRIYQTSDGRYLSVAPLEQRFWENFCQAIGLEEALWNDEADAEATLKGVAACVAADTAENWETRLKNLDVCCHVVRNLNEALADPHFIERGLFAKKVKMENGGLAALPVPVSPNFRDAEMEKPYPLKPGVHNQQVLGDKNKK